MGYSNCRQFSRFGTLLAAKSEGLDMECSSIKSHRWNRAYTKRQRLWTGLRLSDLTPTEPTLDLSSNYLGAHQRDDVAAAEPSAPNYRFSLD